MLLSENETTSHAALVKSLCSMLEQNGMKLYLKSLQGLMHLER
jgi:hypothetical protein